MSSPDTSIVAMPVQPGVDGLLGEVLLGGDAEGCGLHAHRQVLRDDRDLLPVLGEVHRDGEDAAVVVAEAHAGGQHRRRRCC